MPPDRLDLSRVTLVAASNFAVGQTLAAMARCLDSARFGGALLFGPDRVPAAGAAITVIPEPGIDSIAAYSRFMLRRLGDHVTTDFALVVQWDGFIIDPGAWDDAFFGYDYIGAAWPQFADGRDVGNGGFSLRSRRLLRACQDPRLPADGPEDLTICRSGRAFLESVHGIRIAPRALADRFAFERTSPPARTFGFHGVFNLPAVLGDRFGPFYRALPAGAINRRDNRALLRGAIAARKCRLALAILARERAERGWTGGVAGALAAAAWHALRRPFADRNQTRSF